MRASHWHIAWTLCLRCVVGPSSVPTSLCCNQKQCRAASRRVFVYLRIYIIFFVSINYSSDFERLRIRRHRPTKYLLHSSHLYGAYLAIDHHSPRVVVTSFPLNTDRPSNISDLGFCTAEQCRFLISSPVQSKKSSKPREALTSLHSARQKPRRST